MATKAHLTKWLKDFCGLSNRNIPEDTIESLLTAYNAAFSGVNDQAFELACQAYVRDGEFFPPRPSELASLLPKGTNAEPTGDYRMRAGVRCGTCGKYKLCIQEPALGGPLRCRECYSGMSDQKYRDNMNALAAVNAKEGVYAEWSPRSKTISLTDSKPMSDATQEEIF